MANQLTAVVEAIRKAIAKPALQVGNTLLGATAGTARGLFRARTGLVVVAAVGAAGYAVWQNPPVQSVERGQIAIRTNYLTGGSSEWRDGSVVVLPGLHDLCRYPLRDQVYRATKSARADGEAPFQSLEGLSVGVDLTVRYALDPSRISAMARSLPDDINGEIVEPAVQGVIYKTFTRYTVREIFSTKRTEIQQSIEAELKPRLAADGILLRTVQVGKIDLPADYRAGMERLLAEELASEKMRYTLELKEKQVKESELVAEAEKVRREKQAEAAGNEQIISARAQEQAMKHVLPFKQKQIEQRQLEAEAEKVSRVKTAEGNAQARRIEAAGEADSRQKLADAEVYRMEKVGKVTSDQMERDGKLITRHPLLIQKALADKLSDKITVIIASPPTDGGFIGANLLGIQKNKNTATNAAVDMPPADDADAGNAGNNGSTSAARSE